LTVETIQLISDLREALQKDWVDFEINLPDKDFLAIAKRAHANNVTFNEQICLILEEFIQAESAEQDDSLDSIDEVEFPGKVEYPMSGNQLLKAFAAMYRGGSQGATLDADAAQALAEAIDSVIPLSDLLDVTEGEHVLGSNWATEDWNDR
jgi:hypothetical protein